MLIFEWALTAEFGLISIKISAKVATKPSCFYRGARGLRFFYEPWQTMTLQPQQQQRVNNEDKTDTRSNNQSSENDIQPLELARPLYSIVSYLVLSSVGALKVMKALKTTIYG